jgi:hypothetical protein
VRISAINSTRDLFVSKDAKSSTKSKVSKSDALVTPDDNSFFSILKANHMLIKPVRSYTKTTMSKHWLHKYPNLLKGIVINRPEQVFVSDITYIKSKQRTPLLFRILSI